LVLATGTGRRHIVARETEAKPMIRKLLVIVLLVGLTASLGACGRKDKPEHPPGSDYPRQYPGW
jgi:hypothetical protein